MESHSHGESTWRKVFKKRESALPNGANRPSQKRLKLNALGNRGFSAAVRTEGGVGRE